jgi:hypothetical protein
MHPFSFEPKSVFKKYLVLFITIGAFNNVLAQDECGYMKNYFYKKQTVAGYEKNRADFDKKIKSALQKKTEILQNEEPETYIIPVVVHVLWKEQLEKLSEEAVAIQLARLNEDYNNLNYDQIYVPNYFKPLIGNMRIRFVLAQTDPENRPTNGIVYKETQTRFNQSLLYNDDYMKLESKGGSDAWDPLQYLNIWVCDLGDALNGYATFPEDLIGAEIKRDGVVISTLAFGISPINRGGYNFGRTLVHEVGHWLGLRHIWGDDDGPPEKNIYLPEACRNSGTPNFCQYDDCIDDTPLQGKRSKGSHPFSYKQFSCSNGPNGDMWMNYMDYVSHLNRLMFSKGQVERARTVLTNTRSMLLDSKGLKPPTYSQGNVESFRTSAFTAVGVGKDGYIWAGTNLFGLYKYNFNSWTEVPALANRDIRQIATDKQGGIWIAQTGYEDTRGIGGGINYFPDTVATNFSYVSTSGGLPSRLCRGVFVDTNLTVPQNNIWTANVPERNFVIENENVVSIFSGGGIGLKLYSQSFQKKTTGLNPSPIGNGTYVAKTIGGNKNEIWLFDDAVVNQSKIVRYNALNQTPITPSFDHNNTNGKLAAGFFVNSIYFDKLANKWLGLERGGVVYADKDNLWKQLTLPADMNADVVVNTITGDNSNNIFIGTSQGLVVFNLADIADTKKYKLLRLEDNLPSDNVTALAVHEKRKLLVVATDNGITLLPKDCILQTCEAASPQISFSMANGSWNNPAIWSNGQVPQCGSIVVIQHQVQVNNKANAGSIELIEGALRVEPEVLLIVCQQ